MKNNLNIKTLGQVFTNNEIVSIMLSLMKNNGNILEPSAGDGAFAFKLDKTKSTFIEYDKNLAKKNNFINIDFFNYSLKNKFDTIIGNPPYVKYQNIDYKTKENIIKNKFDDIFDKRTNLFLFFIYKSILHLKKNGELIFITPREFLKSTSAIKLNKFLYENGTITDIIEMGDEKIWENSSPNTIIWRFEKNNFFRKTKNDKKFIYNKGQLLFLEKDYSISFSDIAFVKVGAVSGADSIFEHKDGIDIVCSYTNKTGKYKKMLFNIEHPHLYKNKKKLLKRKIKNFNENNYYMWGRKHYESDRPRIYVNGKTRNKNPFFISDSKIYDGSILAIFPLKELNSEQLKLMCQYLNEINWDELGFVVNNRFIFNQKSLENILLPKKFKIFL